MEWIRSHPYACALGVACIVVVLGTILVVDRAATPASSGVAAWNGNSGELGATTSGAGGAQPGISEAITTGSSTENYGTETLPYPSNEPVSDSQGTIETGSASTSYDFNALIAELSQKGLPPGPGGAPASTTGTSAVSAWAYIPTGLVSTVNATPARTPTEQALYQYGNEVGSLIEGYDAAHRDETQVLSDANNDRQNAAKQAAVEKIGQGLETVGEGMAEISDIPPAATADNAALSANYIDIGKKLIVVGQSEPLQDSTLVSAIETYDTAVNAFGTNYIALANLFSLSGVTFGSSDPGSVFSFSPSAL